MPHLKILKENKRKIAAQDFLQYFPSSPHLSFLLLFSPFFKNKIVCIKVKNKNDCNKRDTRYVFCRGVCSNGEWSNHQRATDKVKFPDAKWKIHVGLIQRFEELCLLIYHLLYKQGRIHGYPGHVLVGRSSEKVICKIFG